MPKTIQLLVTVSRPAFLSAMASWFTIGFSWGVEPPLRLTELATPTILSLSVIMLSSIIGLQVNNIFDHDLDCQDNRKKELVLAVDRLGIDNLKLLVVVEFLLGFAFVFLILINHRSIALLFMWIAGMFLGYAYSAPPLRLKSRSLLSLITLLLVLCILPLLFVFHTFTSRLDSLFFVFLVGQISSVYGLILPTEIRDFFEDRKSNIETMTVRIGLVRASFLSIALLAIGGFLTGAAFFLKLAYGRQSALTVFLLTLAIADCIILRRLGRLHSLSLEYTSLKDKNSKAEDIKELASHSPQWIILASQSAVFMSIILLMTKILL